MNPTIVVWLRRGLLCALMLTLLLSQTACSSSIASKDIASSRQPSDDVTSGFYDGTLMHDGRERDFTVYIPTAYNGKKALPLIVALHGGLGTGKKFEEQTRISRAANEYGYIVAYPDGVWRAWNAGSCCGKPADDNIDDVGFVGALVAYLHDRYQIDTQRVYGTGFSNGAMLLHRIACDKPHLLAGIAAVSGGPMVNKCPGGDVPIPTILVQGTDDPRIPWNGGKVNDSYRMAFDKVVDKYAQRNQCSTGKKQVYEQGDTTCWARQGCKDSLTYCEIKGGGHQWPGGETVMHFMLGDNTQNYDASRQLVQFFNSIGAKQ